MKKFEEEKFVWKKKYLLYVFVAIYICLSLFLVSFAEYIFPNFINTENYNPEILFLPIMYTMIYFNVAEFINKNKMDFSLMVDVSIIMIICEIFFRFVVKIFFTE